MKTQGEQQVLTILISLLFWAQMPSALFAQSNQNKRSSEFGADIYSITNFSITEPTQSIGTYGKNISIGNRRTKINNLDSQLFRSIFKETNSLNSSQINFISLNKGTPWPVNVGIHAGVIQNSPLRMVSANVDIMIFEKPMWPTLGTRIRAQRLIGSKLIQQQSNTAQLSISYGKRELTGYCGAEYTAGTATWKSNSVETTNETARDFDVNYTGRAFLLGGQFSLFTGLANLNVELSRSKDTSESLTTKLTFKL